MAGSINIPNCISQDSLPVDEITGVASIPEEHVPPLKPVGKLLNQLAYVTSGTVLSNRAFSSRKGQIVSLFSCLCVCLFNINYEF